MSLRLMATCPKNLSRPTRDLCITMRKRMYFSGFPCISKPGSSKEASSFQTGSRVFSATEVEYFSLPSWIIVYVSLVPLLPFGLRSLAWSTVTCTWVGNHFWACSESIILSFFSAPSSPAQAGPLPQGEPDSLNHCILRTLNGDRQTHSCPTSLRLMSKRLAGAAWGHSCSGGPLSSGEAQGPTITWPRSPGLRAEARALRPHLHAPPAPGTGPRRRLVAPRPPGRWGQAAKARTEGGRGGRAPPPQFAAPGFPPASSAPPARPALVRWPGWAPPPDPGNTNRRRLVRPRSLSQTSPASSPSPRLLLSGGPGGGGGSLWGGVGPGAGDAAAPARKDRGVGRWRKDGGRGSRPSRAGGS